jgi:RTX calcium-binding nonapeptide repeat (4 copies)
MKKLLLISFALLALSAPGWSQAAGKTYTVLLAGSEDANAIKIWLSRDGRQYVIDSPVDLEVGGTVCAHAEEKSNQLICDAASIAGFAVNAGGGDDRVWVAKDVAVPMTMRGGGGDDSLLGGEGADKLIGGADDDRLSGWRGDDLLYGGPGEDMLMGGAGEDVLQGGSGEDKLIGGPGSDDILQRPVPPRPTPAGRSAAVVLVRLLSQ